ncbi:MAG: class I SAM-dependent methyltransferase [Candidatus Methanomethylophilaceae archaeon]|jgi:ubiquinone/menaquinone biosynthesis C-methylase UbiE
MEQRPADFFRFGDPKGAEGRESLASMNEHHRELSEWALSLLPSDLSPRNILDVGCGGGMQLLMLGRKYPRAHLHGADPSDEAVKLTSETNASGIKSGRCRIDMSPVEDLPYPNGSFDLVSAFETYFFWKDLDTALGEIRRVLSPGGKLIVVSEQYPDPAFDKRNAEYAKRTGMRLVKNDEMISVMALHGLNAEFKTVPEKNWVCFIATKY